MIDNKICDNCNHLLVCSKMSTIDKFDTESKKFIGVDMRILNCRDYDSVLEDGEIN